MNGLLSPATNRVRAAVVAVAAVIAATLVIPLTPAHAAGRPEVAGYAPRKDVLRIERADGSRARLNIADNVRVKLVDRDGNVSAGDVNELVGGAKILRMKKVDGEVVRIKLREQPTGSADCSFDTGDGTTDAESFDCSHDYGDATSDCSYDSSSEPDGGDMSWSCSYEEESEGDEEGLSWDCSMDSSSSSWSDAWGGDSDADFSFDCSWEGDDPDAAAPLWDCSFMPGQFGFRCVSQRLGQEFGYTLDPQDLSVNGGVDFAKDVVATPAPSSGAPVDCRGGGGSYDCSFDGEQETGECSVDWSFDSSSEEGEGDVSGDLSYSCDWETEENDDE